MKRIVGCFLFLLLFCVPSLDAKGRSSKRASKDKSFQVSVKRLGKKKVYFAVKGNFGYPDGTVLVLGLKYVQEHRYIEWYRIPLKDGKFSTKLGPFSKIFLPGDYMVEVLFKVAIQPVKISRLLCQKFGYSPFFVKKIKEKSVPFGSKSERKEVYKKLGKKYFKYLKQIRAMYLKTNKKFHWIKKRETMPPLATWETYRKETLKELRALLKTMRNWKKSYQILLYSIWIEDMGDLMEKIYGLNKSYKHFYSLAKIKNKKQRVIMEKLVESRCRKKRIFIEYSLNKMARTMQKFINPKWKPTGESGVE